MRYFNVLEARDFAPPVSTFIVSKNSSPTSPQITEHANTAECEE